MSVNERTVLTATEKSPIVSHEHRNRNHHRSRSPAGRFGQLARVLAEAMKRLPKDFPRDAMLTAEQFAKWVQLPVRTVIEKSRGPFAVFKAFRIGRNTLRWHVATNLDHMANKEKPCV